MTVAAANLNVSVSAVSMAMSQLERTLGVQLFIRQPNRSILLSPTGKRLAHESDAFLEHADSLAEKISAFEGSLTGTLSVGVFAPIAPFRLPGLLNEFERRHPHVHVDFIEADLAQLQQALRTGDCEIALLYGHGLDAGLAVQTVDTVDPHVLVSAKHPAAQRGTPVHLREFADEPLIQLDLPLSRQYYERLFHLAGITPRVRHRFSGYETVRSFVGMGHGYAVLNQRITASTYLETQTVALPIADPLPAIEVVIAWPENIRLTRRASAFAAVCKDLNGFSLLNNFSVE